MPRFSAALLILAERDKSESCSCVFRFGDGFLAGVSGASDNPLSSNFLLRSSLPLEAGAFHVPSSFDAAPHGAPYDTNTISKSTPRNLSKALLMAATIHSLRFPNTPPPNAVKN